MTRIYALIFAVALGATACAGVFDKCVKPEITAATKLAPADLAKEVAAFLTCGIADLPDLAAPCAVAGLADLALALGPGGADAVNCIVSYYENNASGLLQSRAKAVGAKRGVTPELYGSHACNEKFVSGASGALASSRDTAIHGERPTTAGRMTLNLLRGGPEAGHRAHNPTSQVQFLAPQPLTACDAACGKPLTGLVTPSGCSCWRASKTNWRESRWVALAR